MEITTSMVKELRVSTGAGVLDCKKALEETGGDFEKAIQVLRRRGLAIAAKKSGRATDEGLIEAYVHLEGRIAALVELNCETDFVARTEDFKSLAHDLAMQVAAVDPQYVAPEDIPPDVLEEQKAKYRAQAHEMGKPPSVVERIVEGKLNSFYDEACLLRQPFIKDEDITVEELIAEKIAKLGENIVVRRFVRYELGR